MKIFQGIDIASIRRMEKAIQRGGKSFLNKVFTAREQKYCETKRMKYEHYAARFAAKEAVLKAARVTRKAGLLFREIEVRHYPTGKPLITLSPAARKKLKLPANCQIELSLAHEREFAMATVLLVIPS